jgi:hypothetical protein
MAAGHMAAALSGDAGRRADARFGMIAISIPRNTEHAYSPTTRTAFRKRKRPGCSGWFREVQLGASRRAAK